MAKQRNRKQIVNKAEVSQFERFSDAVLSRAMRGILNLSFLKSCFLETPFGRLHYYDSAPDSHDTPVVLLHGMGSSGQSLSLIAAMLATSTRVVIPDLFHFGGFSVPNRSVMTVQEHTDSVALLIENLAHGKPVHVCGLSLGGWLGLWLAVKKPQLLESLSLLNPAGVELREWNLKDTLLYLNWDKFGALFPNIMAAPPYANTVVLSRFAKRSMFKVLKNDAVAEFVKAVSKDDLLDTHLEHISTPVLLMWGKEDRLLSTKAPFVLAEKLKNVEAYFVENCGHILCLEAPRNVFESLMTYWNREPKRDALILKLTSKAFPLYATERVESQSA